MHCKNYTENVKRYCKVSFRSRGVNSFAPSGLRALRELRGEKRAEDSVGSMFSSRTNVGAEKIRTVGLHDRTVKRRSAAPRKKGSRGQNLINQETVSALQEEVEYLWTVYRIDPYYRRAYLESLAKLHIATYIQLLAKEIENLYNEKAAIQQLYLAIQKREEQIKYIRQLNQFLADGKSGPEARENVFFIYNAK